MSIGFLKKNSVFLNIFYFNMYKILYNLKCKSLYYKELDLDFLISLYYRNLGFIHKQRKSIVDNLWKVVKNVCRTSIFGEILKFLS